MPAPTWTTAILSFPVLLAGHVPINRAQVAIITVPSSVAGLWSPIASIALSSVPILMPPIRIPAVTLGAK